MGDVAIARTLIKGMVCELPQERQKILYAALEELKARLEKEPEDTRMIISFLLFADYAKDLL